MNLILLKMMEAEINKNNCFTVSYDNFGSIIFHKKSKFLNAPKFMVAKHIWMKLDS